MAQLLHEQGFSKANEHRKPENSIV